MQQHWQLVLSFLAILCSPVSAQQTFQQTAFEDEIARQMQLIEQAYLRVDGVEFEPTVVDSENDNVTFAKGDDGIRVYLMNGKPTGRVVLRYHADNGEPVDLVGDGLRVTSTNVGIHIQGKVSDARGTESHELELLINEEFVGAGTSQISVNGQVAVLRGELGTRTYVQIKTLLSRHPEVKTLVFADVPGSVNDVVNMQTGRLVRAAGLTTFIGAGGSASSGGVDLFVAGRKRVVQAGAELGVHSWCCVDGLEARSLPPNHKGHAAQIRYFEEMLGSSGRAFYFFTLKMGSHDDMHAMSPAEIRNWGIATDWVE